MGSSGNPAEVRTIFQGVLEEAPVARKRSTPMTLRRVSELLLERADEFDKESPRARELEEAARYVELQGKVGRPGRPKRPGSGGELAREMRRRARS